MEYNLTISEKQALVIIHALDLFSRIGIGQLREILRHPQYWNMSFEIDKYKHIEKLLEEVKTLLTGLKSNESYGMGHTEAHEDCNISYDLLQVIRHKLAWDRRPEGGWSIDFDPPSQYAKKEELAVILSLINQHSPTIIGVDMSIL